MKFFILIVCILLQTLLNLRLSRNQYRFVDHYAATMKPLLAKVNMDTGFGALLGLLLPVLLLIVVLNLVFAHFGLIYFLYGVVILMLCLDVTDMKKRLTSYFASMSQQNLSVAKVEAEKFAGHPVSLQSSEICRAITETLFTDSLKNVFAVIFWFMLLGPFGAILYALITTITERSQQADFGFSDTYTQAGYVKEILDWLPVRFLTLTFALMGSFNPVFHLWIERVGGGLLENRQFVVDAGLTAIHADLDHSKADLKENHNALTLVRRVLWAWVAIVAILSVFSAI